MLRPLSDQHTVAYFDSASFWPAEPGAGEVVLRPAQAGLSGNADASASGRSAEALEASPAAAGTRLRLANVKPAVTPDPSNAAAVGGGNESWAIVLAIGVAVAAIAIAGGYELWQRRIAWGGDDKLPDD
jgi:hypothetical protein